MNATRIKGIIFDFDGTLADTLPLCIVSFQQMFERITGKAYTKEEIVKYFGRAEEGIILTLAPDQYDECMREYVATYKNNHHMCAEVFTGIREILEMIRSKNLKMALITGKGQHTIEVSLEYLGLREYFEFVEPGDPDKSIKTECLKKIADLWKLDSSEIAYIGDQPSDIKDSKMAGATAVAVSWATTSDHANLQEHSPDLLFRTTDEFMSWLAKIGG